MPRYEYRIEYATPLRRQGDLGRASAQEWLNELGADGWLLVSDSGPNSVFVREAETPQVETLIEAPRRGPGRPKGSHNRPAEVEYA